MRIVTNFSDEHNILLLSVINFRIVLDSTFLSDSQDNGIENFLKEIIKTKYYLSRRRRS